MPEFMLTPAQRTINKRGSIAVLVDGRFVVSWTDFSFTGGDCPPAQRYAPKSLIPPFFDGTASSDSVTGGNFNDRYFGYAGDDSISGFGG